MSKSFLVFIVFLVIIASKNAQSIQQIGRTHFISPPFYEALGSRISHHIFPQYFAKFEYYSSSDPRQWYGFVSGYKEWKVKVPCPVNQVKKQIDGVEEVYATALALGLEVSDTQCIRVNNRTQLYIDFFQYPFHRLRRPGFLITQYRTHKIVGPQQGTLFPQQFLSDKCGLWVGRNCSLARMLSAYSKILNTKEEAIRIFKQTIKESYKIETSLKIAITHDYYESTNFLLRRLIYNFQNLKQMYNEIVFQSPKYVCFESESCY